MLSFYVLSAMLGYECNRHRIYAYCCQPIVAIFTTNYAINGVMALRKRSKLRRKQSSNKASFRYNIKQILNIGDASCKLQKRPARGETHISKLCFRSVLKLYAREVDISQNCKLDWAIRT